MRIVLIIIFAAVVVLPIYLIANLTNNPYPADEKGRNIFYSNFTGEPKHLDPARAYSNDEYEFLNQICEPIVQYHYLKRKPSYQLVPLTCEQVPEAKMYDKDGKELGSDAPVEAVVKSVYEIKLKPGIRYQDHPCFAKDAGGKYRWHLAMGESFPKIQHPKNLADVATRTLRAEDYVYQIKRLANPTLECPIAETLVSHLEGFGDLQKKLDEEIGKIRGERRKNGGMFFNQEADEKRNPIYLDMRQPQFDLPGAQVIDELTFRITLTNKYPQMRFWLAMPFFTPVPWEADRFYSQSAAIEQNITLDRFPVGTGAYTLDENNPNYRMVLKRNPNYHPETYPSEGDPEDAGNGLLADAGKTLPFIEEAVYVAEKLPVPKWNKVLQGYYDTSGIESDMYDQAIKISGAGELGLSEEMQAKHLTLATAVETSTWYYAFNMNDPIVGGLDEKKCKLRQALAIAINTEEEIQIFDNGRGIPAQSPMPPGIFGHEDGKEGIDPYVYDWDDKRGAPRRKSLDEAKKLMADAGYPNGRDESGKVLVVNYDCAEQMSEKANLDWMRKQFRQLGVELNLRTTDYNRFQEKVNNGDIQFFKWGWIADYPDPENFLFLLYGPKSASKTPEGPNSANYDNPAFNDRFLKMVNMSDTPERMKIIREMLAIANKDAPWSWGFHPVAFGLAHEWLKNSKPMLLGGNSLKYKRIDAQLREQRRAEWNQPVRYPIWIALTLLVLTAIPAAFIVYRRERSAPAA